MMYAQNLFPPLLLANPEEAHDIACKALQTCSKLGVFNPFRQVVKAKPYTCMGLTFPNRVGLAAGMDKNGDYIEGFQDLGLGHLEVGSVTAIPQAGNPKPRVWASATKMEIENHMGMPNKGIQHCVDALRHIKKNQRLPIGISIAPTTGAKYPFLELHSAYMAAKRVADYVTVNLSCPNVSGHGMDAASTLRKLSTAVTACNVPTLVKMPRQLSSVEETESLLWWVKINGFAGVVCANSPHGPRGGRSGYSLKSTTLLKVRLARSVLGPKATIIASGGILSPLDAIQAVNAGADLVQIYTGLVYEGPKLIKQIAEALPGNRNEV